MQNNIQIFKYRADNMQTLEFTTNFNGKLFLSNFGTVRLHNPAKYFVNNKLEVKLKGSLLGEVQVNAVRVFAFKKITDALSYLDVGKPAAYLAELLKKMYDKKTGITGETLLDHVIVQYTNRNIEAHEFNLQEWWSRIKEDYCDKPFQQSLSL